MCIRDRKIIVLRASKEMQKKLVGKHLSVMESIDTVLRTASDGEERMDWENAEIMSELMGRVLRWKKNDKRKKGAERLARPSASRRSTPSTALGMLSLEEGEVVEKHAPPPHPSSFIPPGTGEQTARTKPPPLGRVSVSKGGKRNVAMINNPAASRSPTRRETGGRRRITAPSPDTRRTTRPSRSRSPSQRGGEEMWETSPNERYRRGPDGPPWSNKSCREYPKERGGYRGRRNSRRTDSPTSPVRFEDRKDIEAVDYRWDKINYAYGWQLTDLRRHRYDKNYRELEVCKGNDNFLVRIHSTCISGSPHAKILIKRRVKTANLKGDPNIFLSISEACLFKTLMNVFRKKVENLSLGGRAPDSHDSRMEWLETEIRRVALAGTGVIRAFDLVPNWAPRSGAVIAIYPVLMTGPDDALETGRLARLAIPMNICRRLEAAISELICN